MFIRPAPTRRDDTPDHTQARSGLIRCPGSELTGDHLFAGIRLVAGPRDAGMPNPESGPLVIARQRRLLDRPGGHLRTRVTRALHGAGDMTTGEPDQRRGLLPPDAGLTIAAALLSGATERNVHDLLQLVAQPEPIARRTAIASNERGPALEPTCAASAINEAP